MNTQDLASVIKTDKLNTLTVGATSTLTPVIDLRYFQSMKISFMIKTLTGTDVQIEKIVCSQTGAFAGEEVNITDFTKSLIDRTATAINTIVTVSAKDSSVGIYNYAKVSFKGTAAANEIVYSIELGGASKLPIE